MKKLICLFVFFVFIFNLQGQSDIDAVTDEICDCLKKEDYKAMNSIEASEFVEACVMASTMSHMNFFLEGIDENNVGEAELSLAMQKKGEAVAIHAAKTCPDFLELMVVMAKVEEEANAASDIEEQKGNIVTGKFAKFNTKTFFSADLVEADGREHKLYWMEHFEGAMKLKNEAKESIGKTVEVSYKVVESYNPQLQDYSQIKVITGIVWK